MHEIAYIKELSWWNRKHYIAQTIFYPQWWKVTCDQEMRTLLIAYETNDDRTTTYLFFNIWKYAFRNGVTFMWSYTTEPWKLVTLEDWQELKQLHLSYYR